MGNNIIVKISVYLLIISLFLLFSTIAYSQTDPLDQFGNTGELQSSNENQASYSYNLVTGGKQLSISLKNPNIPIIKLQLITNDDVEDVNFNFEVVSKPNAKKLDDVYKYILITAPKITDDNVRIAILRFKVSNDWFEENDYDLEEVKLLRFHNDEWEELKTVYEGSDSKNHQYRAATPGFSYFAVKAEKSETGEVKTLDSSRTEEETNEESGQEEDQGANKIIETVVSRGRKANPVVGITITVVIVILGTALVLFFKDKTKI